MANIKLPDNFIPTRYPGYYWDIKNKLLYSIKGSGELKQLKLQKGGYYRFGLNKKIPPHYAVSYKGWKKTYSLEYLNSLTKPETDTIIYPADYTKNNSIEDMMLDAIKLTIEQNKRIERLEMEMSYFKTKINQLVNKQDYD